MLINVHNLEGRIYLVGSRGRIHLVSTGVSQWLATGVGVVLLVQS